MTCRNRVIWSEGLFIKPQHFQQQQRSLEGLLDTRLQALGRFFYGFESLELNAEFLRFGRIGISRASGVMPDGTAFRFPEDDLEPVPLAIEDASITNQVVYLALPLGSDTIGEVGDSSDDFGARYRSSTRHLRDLHTRDGDSVDIEVACVSPRLLLEREDRSAYCCLAVARVLELRPDGTLVLDERFLPTLLNAKVSPVLERFISETEGLMHERARRIAERLSMPKQSEGVDGSDFMLLQVLNRLQPRFQHLATLGHLHPERLHELLLEAVGELSTFTDASRMPPEFPPYAHDQPQRSLYRLMDCMRQALSTVLEPRALAIQLQPQPYGVSAAILSDKSLLENAELVLAVHADMPTEQLRHQFLQRAKVASVERIRDLVSLQLPGLVLEPLPMAPRELPYHAGYSYFRLDRHCEAWSMMSDASGIAIHVSGELPGLEMQFWAIRS